ncbi:GIY-YIG nuclease family protein [Lachnospiraceae bacterium OttesenSCG-928-J05]|nr:GIY-YIG nuclease family protein [Lachnospiraceae bacterium OttesenSCG-928-J05]MDL2276342.1 GIY-YIG nuclease family protein [Breznakia sp. OttesenSCG-928-G09]
MDMKRKKELLDEWKNRHPEMGVVSIRCKATGDLFLGVSNDTRVWFNSHYFKLSSNYHPNKELQELWNKYGENEFEHSVVKVLKYENLTDDQTDNLEALLEKCMMEMSQEKRIWK